MTFYPNYIYYKRILEQPVLHCIPDTSASFILLIKQSFDIMYKCPLHFNHGPAIDIISVLHSPLALIKTTASSASSGLLNGCNNCTASQ